MDAAGACDFGVNDDICLVGAVTAGWVTEVEIGRASCRERV